MAAKKKTASSSSSKAAKTTAMALGAGRVTVPGLRDSKGMAGFLVLPPGTFSVECLSAKIKPSKDKPSDGWNFVFKLLDGTDDEGVSLVGKRWGHRVNILRPQHPAYNTIGIDELKSMCLAFGVVPKGDDISPGAFQNLKCSVRVGVKMGLGPKGEDSAENTVSEWIAD